MSPPPVIDLAGTDEAVARAVGRACEEVGFFYVANHGVVSVLVRSVLEQTRRFHALPIEEKDKLAINRFHRGYIGLESYRLGDGLAPNLSESIVFMHELEPDDPALVAEEPLSGPNQWPELPGFRDTMLEYTVALGSLGRRILRAFAVSLGLAPDYFAPMFTSPTTFLRLLHYPVQSPDDAGNRFGSAPHTDYGAITILAQDATGGLDVKHRSDGWVPAVPIEDTFLVNIGDVMARWTNDRFVSTMHRVRNASGRDRYSVPFFFDPSMDTRIECLPSCKRADVTARYEPVAYGDYLLSRLDAHYAYRGRGASV